jgi:tricarballylate dehydrogenase
MKVHLLERADKKGRGGNSRYTEAYLRIKSETQISDDFEEKLAQNATGTIDPELLKQTTMAYDQWPPMLKAYGFTDPELISSFAEGVPTVIGWLRSFGVKFLSVKPFATHELLTERMAPSGGGEAVVESLASAAEKLGVIFHYETAAKELIRNKKGKIEGVLGYSKKNGYQEFKSKATILASGGFQGNLEMMTRYLGKHSHYTRPVAPGGMYNKGEGIEMALKLGAAPAGQYDAFHAEPVDPRSGMPEALVGILNHGILINKDGKRFVDEGSNYYELIYEDVSRAVLMQKNGEAYFIYDSKIEDIPNYETRIKTDRQPIKANSIKELGLKLGVDELQLEKTIKNYNASIQDGHFKPAILDGKCTLGIKPPKSNWARIINEDELMAYPVMCANCFTFGGLKISPNAEVINCDGWVIPGLYAAGEVIGLYYNSYVGSTSVLRGLVFGYKAGRSAGDYCANT